MLHLKAAARLTGVSMTRSDDFFMSGTHHCFIPFQFIIKSQKIVTIAGSGTKLKSMQQSRCHYLNRRM